jgi:formate hydrogenlyase subunit 5
MKIIVDKAEGIDANSELWPKTGGVRYIPVTETDCYDTLNGLAGKDVVLISLFCAENFAERQGYTLFYVLEKRACHPLIVLQCHLNGNTARSAARLFPSASWFEREIRDGFGVDFPDAFDKRRLFLHECYPPEFHPLRKDFHNQPVSPLTEIPPGLAYPFKEVSGEGVYQIPVGPVHAGIIEPGHFRFSVIGETVFNLEIRMFYKHRGIEKLAEGKTPGQGVTMAETISGDESAANAVAFAMSVEKICGAPVPPRAGQLRIVLLEMERIYSHLGDMAGMILDVAYSRGASRFFTLREEILRWNDRLSGSRFLKNIVCPGGLKRDIDNEALKELSGYLETFSTRFKSILHLVHSTSSVVDRLQNTGVLPGHIINPLNITGPAARASGCLIDTRRDHPYGLYPALDFKVRSADTGDVIGRFNVKTEEIFDAAAMIRNLIGSLDTEAPVFTEPAVKDGSALSLVESARGQNLHFVHIKNGLIDRYKVRTASFCNWQAIEHAVPGNIVPDFPLINKSLNLSYAGTDL